VNCNLYGVGGSFDLRAKKLEKQGLFLGASSPRPGNGLFLKTD
jgi:hypothetical protein